MWVEAALLIYAGLACLARASHRHSGHGRPVVRLSYLRGVGWGMLTTAMIVVWHSLGAAQGILTFLSLVMAIGMALVVLLSRWPPAALLVTVPFTRTGRDRTSA